MSLEDKEWKLYLKTEIKTPDGKDVLYPMSKIYDYYFSDNLKSIYDEFNIPEGYILFICSKRFTIPAANVKWNKSILSNLTASVLYNGKIETPKVWFEFLKNLNKADFSLPVVLPNGEYVMDFPFSFYLPFKTEYMKNMIARVFDIDEKSLFITKDWRGIYETKNSECIITSIINNQLFIVCNFTQKHLKMIKERSGVMSELFRSEAIYRMELQTTVNKIIPFFEQYKVLDKKTYEEAKSVLEKLCDLHTSLIREFEKCIFPFMAPFGKILLNYVKKIGIYDDYSDIYSKISDQFYHFISEKTENADIVENMNRNPELQGKIIPSYLIIPIQRIPRYKLLLERISKVTPEGHPDKIYALTALEELKKFRYMLNEKTVLSTSKDNFSKKLNEYSEIIHLDSSHSFIERFDVKFEGVDSIIAVFSDSLYIFPKNLKTKEEITIFQYCDLRIEPKDIVSFYLYTFKKHYIIEFEHDNVATLFDELMEETVVQRQTKLASNGIGLKWEFVKSSSFAISRHCMVEMNNRLWIFGGIDDKDRILSKIYYFSLKRNKWKKPKVNSTKNPPKRYGAVMIPYNNRLYLYGGKNLDGDLYDFWEFDVESFSWKKLKVPKNLPGGLGLSITVHNDKFILAGGRDNFRTFTYSPQTSKWNEIQSNIPLPPFMFHTLVSYHEYIYLIGGITRDNEFSTKIYLLSEDGKWDYNPEHFYGFYPFPRFGHCSIKFKDCIWVIGGSGSNIPFVMNSINQWNITHFYGDYPPLLSNFGSAAAEDCIWIYGGNNPDGPSSNLYKLTFVDKKK